MDDVSTGHDFEKELQAIAQRGLFRSRVTMDSPQGTTVRLGQQELINFSSNDYLGLANDAGLRTALAAAIEQYGVGSGASPLVCGHTKAHHKLEESITDMTGRERAVLFSSGYLANLAVVATFSPGRDGAVIQDRLNHASLLDGAVLGRARLRRYRHLDLAHLEQRLASVRGDKLVVTEAVFSMDGDQAPLDQIASLCTQYRALLAVDDAHGLGVFGTKGEGSLSLFGLSEREVPLVILTFGKAVGVSGACVAGRADLIELMIQRARPYMYSTAMPPAIAAAITYSLDVIQAAADRRHRLTALIRQFRQGCQARGLPVKDSITPVQPLMIGANADAVRVSELLHSKGLLVTAIRPPTVPANMARLRITISAAHTPAQVDVLLDALAEILREG